MRTSIEVISILYMMGKLSAKMMCQVARLACEVGAVGNDLPRFVVFDVVPAFGPSTVPCVDGYSRGTHVNVRFGFDRFLAEHAYDISLPAWI